MTVNDAPERPWPEYPVSIGLLRKDIFEMLQRAVDAVNAEVFEDAQLWLGLAKAHISVLEQQIKAGGKRDA